MGALEGQLRDFHLLNSPFLSLFPHLNTNGRAELLLMQNTLDKRYLNYCWPNEFHHGNEELLFDLIKFK